jgi:NitT/TauT family transport system substrate-binding protein
VAAGALPASAQTKINVAHVFANDFLPMFMAKESGCFAKRGLDVTLTLIPIANNIPATIISGSAQIGMTTPTILLQAVENGLDLVAVAGSSRMMANNPTLSVVMRNDVKVSSVAELKGKRIAAPGINSMAEVVLRRWLFNAGLKPGDVAIVEAPIPQMADMLKGGTVDGIVIMEPIRSRIVGSGGGYRHPSEFFATTAPDAVATFWLASSAWAKANPKPIADMRACLAEGVTQIAAEPEKAKAVELKYVKANAPTYPKFESKIAPSDLKIHADMATSLGLLKKPANLEAMVLP